MKACKHYSYFGKETYLVQSDGNPWNAWLEVWDFNGKLFKSSFETGKFWEYLNHLALNPECREEIGVTETEVRKKLKYLEKEWKGRTE